MDPLHHKTHGLVKMIDVGMAGFLKKLLFGLHFPATVHLCPDRRLIDKDSCTDLGFIAAIAQKVPFHHHMIHQISSF